MVVSIMAMTAQNTPGTAAQACVQLLQRTAVAVASTAECMPCWSLGSAEVACNIHTVACFHTLQSVSGVPSPPAAPLSQPGGLMIKVREAKRGCSLLTQDTAKHHSWTAISQPYQRLQRLCFQDLMNENNGCASGCLMPSSSQLRICVAAVEPTCLQRKTPALRVMRILLRNGHC